MLFVVCWLLRVCLLLFVAGCCVLFVFALCCLAVRWQLLLRLYVLFVEVLAVVRCSLFVARCVLRVARCGLFAM